MKMMLDILSTWLSRNFGRKMRKTWLLLFRWEKIDEYADFDEETGESDIILCNVND